MYYYLDPFGCVKNQVDAETMMAVLNRSGWVSADNAGGADLIIINSCGFIESAKQESINAVLAYRKAYPGKRILLAGCLAQRYAPELSTSLTEADAFFGNADLSRIGEAASAAMGAAAGVPVLVPPPFMPGAVSPSAAEAPAAEFLSFSAGERPLLSLPGSAYVKISEGCNNHCSFCAIPGIRGPLRSRPIPEILAECRQLLNRGIRELCLIGQDLGSYGQDHLAGSTEKQDLPALLEALSGLAGDFWVRLLYIHPDHFPLSILDTMERDGRFLPYFDIPFQHGSAKILAAMNRRGSAEIYLSLIETIRQRLPDATVRSTFLTGFPGEGDEDFQALLNFQEQARLDWAGAFTYSREEDTPAYDMKNRVPKRAAAERKARIEEQQIPITQERMNRFIGRTLDVLVEERINPAVLAVARSAGSANPDAADAAALDEAADGGLYLGRLPCQAPEVDGSAVISTGRSLNPGEILRGRVFARAGFDLEVRVE